MVDVLVSEADGAASNHRSVVARVKSRQEKSETNERTYAQKSGKALYALRKYAYDKLVQTKRLKIDGVEWG